MNQRGLRLVRVRRAAMAALAAAAFHGGCMSPAINDPALVGPFFEPTNLARDVALGGIRRVVLLPVWTGVAAPEETGSDLDPVFRMALQDQNRFEVVVLSRSDCQRRFGASSFSSVAALPHDFMTTLQRVHGADAVMFVDVTVHRAYHPIALGVRAKLVTINATRLVWTFDNLFSAGNPLVAAGARHHFLEREHQGVPGDLSPSVLQSPGRFAAYVASTTFSTLPPVTLGRIFQSSKSPR